MSNREIDYGDIISSMGSDRRKKLVDELVDKEAKRLIVESYSKLDVPIPSGIEDSKLYDVYKKQAKENINDKYGTKIGVPWYTQIGRYASPLVSVYDMYNSYKNSGDIFDMYNSYTNSDDIFDIGNSKDFIKDIGVLDNDTGKYATNLQMLNSLKEMGINATELENMTPAELAKYTNPDLVNLAKNAQNNGDTYLLQKAYNNAVKPKEVVTKTPTEVPTEVPTNTTSNSTAIPELTDDMFAPTNTIQSTTPRRRRISDLSDEERKKFVSSIANTMFNGLN